jgi:hypothetical protein
MDDDTFLARMADWEALPDDIHDDGYGLSPFPCPLDSKFDTLCALFLEANEPQRQMLPELFKAEKSGRRGQAYIRFDKGIGSMVEAFGGLGEMPEMC